MLCLRLDLDYVPWDSVRAESYGHGEPAMILKLLALARELGLKYHFFASVRTMRAFPALANAILGEAHDLDWLCEKPGDVSEFAQAKELFALAGHKILGLAVAGAWPDGADAIYMSGLKFLSADAGSQWEEMQFFPVSGRLDEEHLRAVAARDELQTLVASPQVMAKVDPSLARFEKFAKEHAQSITTLRGELERERKPKLVDTE